MCPSHSKTLVLSLLLPLGGSPHSQLASVGDSHPKAFVSVFQTWGPPCKPLTHPYPSSRALGLPSHPLLQPPQESSPAQPLASSVCAQPTIQPLRLSPLPHPVVTTSCLFWGPPWGHVSPLLTVGSAHLWPLGWEHPLPSNQLIPPSLSLEASRAPKPM